MLNIGTLWTTLIWIGRLYLGLISCDKTAWLGGQPLKKGKASPIKLLKTVPCARAAAFAAGMGASGGSLGALTVARLISPHCVPVQDRRGSGQGYYIGQGAPKTTRRRATCCRERWRASPPPAFVARARLQFAGRPFHVFSERTTPQNGRQPHSPCATLTTKFLRALVHNEGLSAPWTVN